MSDIESKSKLVTKLSPLIEGQVPDFIQSDHPFFVTFLKHYYQFLEAGRIKYDSDIQYIITETNDTEYVVLEGYTDEHPDHIGDRIVTERGDNGSTGHFENNEIVTGSTSGATATVLVEDSRNEQMFITSQQKFITGETITGATSGSTATVTEYRANPVQNIQQLLDYADVDNNIFDFLTQMKESFMNDIPDSLASGVSKRDLIKNIRDLYTAKGTSEGHKLFLRLLLGENAEIVYPNQFMLKVSNGNWSSNAVLRCTTSSGVSGEEALSQLITGKVSGATATVVSVGTFVEGSFTVTEFIIDDIVGTFNDGEIITCTSATRNTDVTYTVSSVVNKATVVNDGILHSVSEDIDVEGLGSGLEKVQVESVAGGSVSEVFVNTVGTGYEVGDDIVLTANSDDQDVSTADAFVSVVGGGILSEDNANNIVLEDGTSSSLQPFQIALEEGNDLSDFFRGDGETKVFTLSNLNANTDTITLQIDDVNLATTNLLNETVWTASGTTLTFTNAPADGVKIFVRGNESNYILLDSTNGTADAGHQLLTDTLQETQDTYTTNDDLIVLESGTFANLSVATEEGNIRKVFVNNGGEGYTKLPVLTITSTSGTGAKLLTLTTDIGRATGLKIINPGFSHTSDNPPELDFRAHFVLKNVSGTFAATNTLTTHSGTVKSYNADTQVLETTFRDVEEIISESDGSNNQGIELENETLTPAGVILEDIQQFDGGGFVTLNGTGTTSPSNVFRRYKITAGSSSADENVIKFFIDGIEAPTLELLEGSTYFFDLSDSSLYNLSESLNRKFQLSTTPDGTNASGTEYTTGITKSATSIRQGTAGAFLKLVVAASSPTLYYYNANLSGFGNTVLTPKLPDTINDADDSILLDGTTSYESVILLEEGTPRSDNATDTLRQESGQAIGTVLGDVNGPEFLLEESIEGAPVQDEGDKLVINAYQELSNSSFLLTEHTGGRVSHETFGNTLVLEDNEQILFEEDEAQYYIVADATATGSRDENYNIILEQPIDFSDRDVVITDSSGASGTIINADIGTGTSTIDTWMQSAGSYIDAFSIIDEDLIRIQDSYYYQDYSYEVKVGQSFSTYINELKRAIHPAGFQPFGKVSIASTISVGLRNAGSFAPEYREKFSPILASSFEALFDETLQMRIAAKKLDGQINDTLVLESGHSIIFEDRNSGGRLMSEESIAPGGDAEGYALQTINVKRETSLPSLRRDNLLLDLAFYPFTENAGIQLENDTPGSFNGGYVVLDGVEVIPQPVLFTILEDESGFVLLEDSGRIRQEGDRWFIPPGDDIADIGEKIHLEEDYEDAGLTFEQVGEIRLSDVFEPDHIRLETIESTYFPDAIEIDEILLESNGQILLDGIDSDATSAGYKVLQETTKRGYFDLDSNGQVEAEEFDSTSVFDKMLQEGVDNIVLEDYFSANDFDDIILEDSSGFILLDGDIVATYSDAQKFRVNLETFETTTTVLTLESTNLITNSGHVPFENYTLSPETTPNKMGLGSLPVVHEAIIDVRATGDVALEDGTDTTGGNLVLNGTNGSSANAGENLDLEGATGITI